MTEKRKFPEQIRRKNLRVYQAMDKTGVTVSYLAKYMRKARETISRDLQKDLPTEKQDKLISAIYAAANARKAEQEAETEGKEVADSEYKNE